MSDFMFGGSALTLDISAVNSSGGSVQNGDILQISLLAADKADGAVAVTPVLDNTGVSQLAPMGVVQAPDGLSIGDGDNCILRMVGKCSVLGKASQAYTADQVVYGTDGKKFLAAGGALSSTAAYVQASYGGRLRGVVLTDITTTTKGELVVCWVSGLP
jgi:hypothetical protein